MPTPKATSPKRDCKMATAGHGAATRHPPDSSQTGQAAFNARRGTAWLAEARTHDVLDVIGPLGRGFSYAADLGSCLLVGGGYGGAPLFFLAEELRARNKLVGMILGARDHERVFKPIEGKRLADTMVITTEDGTMGERGRVTDVLDATLARTGAQVVYACGPNAMLRAVAERCAVRGIPCQVAVEELMACGLGVCWTCAVPRTRRAPASGHRVR